MIVVLLVEKLKETLKWNNIEIVIRDSYSGVFQIEI